MTLQKFFMGRAIVFVLLLVVILSIFGYKAYFSSTRNTEVPEPTTQVNTEPPVFTWKYEQAKTFNLDGIPETNIFLEAKYPSGKVQSKLIDTTPGSCNDLPDSDKDSVPGSTNIQCYSAGLGYRFKIIRGERSYLVERKTFEEASPDYNPPAYNYEVVSEFPVL